VDALIANLLEGFLAVACQMRGNLASAEATLVFERIEPVQPDRIPKRR